MYKHNRIKHSDIKHKCTECNFTHTFPTKVRTHYREVHLGAGRNRRKQEKCGKPNCKDVGKSDCEELLHFVLFCDQCEFSTKRNDNLKHHTKRVHEGLIESFHCWQCEFSTRRNDQLKIHTKRVHEGLIESFSCSQCDFITNLESNLRRHTRGMHISIYGASSGKKTYMGQFPEDGGNGHFVSFFFLKVELSCGQTVKDKFDFSIVLSQLYLLDHQNTSCWTS